MGNDQIYTNRAIIAITEDFKVGAGTTGHPRLALKAPWMVWKMRYMTVGCPTVARIYSPLLHDHCAHPGVQSQPSGQVATAIQA